MGRRGTRMVRATPELVADMTQPGDPRYGDQIGHCFNLRRPPGLTVHKDIITPGLAGATLTVHN